METAPHFSKMSGLGRRGKSNITRDSSSRFKTAVKAHHRFLLDTVGVKLFSSHIFFLTHLTLSAFFKKRNPKRERMRATNSASDTNKMATKTTVDVVVDTVVGDAILPIHEMREVELDAVPRKGE